LYQNLEEPTTSASSENTVADKLQIKKETEPVKEMTSEEKEIQDMINAAFEETATRPETEMAKDPNSTVTIDPRIEEDIKEATKNVILKDNELDRRNTRELLLKVHETLIKVNENQKHFMEAQKTGKSVKKVKEEHDNYTYLPIELWGANPNATKSVFKQSSCDCPNQSAWTSNYMKV
jgi:hypothetical protein